MCPLVPVVRRLQKQASDLLVTCLSVQGLAGQGTLLCCLRRVHNDLRRAGPFACDCQVAFVLSAYIINCAVKGHKSLCLKEFFACGRWRIYSTTGSTVQNYRVNKVLETKKYRVRSKIKPGKITSPIPEKDGLFSSVVS